MDWKVGFIFSIWTLFWLLGTHYYDFRMQERFDIELTVKECGTCFLDSPFDYEIEIEDLKNNQEYEFEFFTGEGPNIRFCMSIDYPDLILIEGYDSNDGLGWLINLNEKTIEQAQPYDDIANKNFVATHELTKKFELKEK